jgi:uncharacterized membrane protein (UPF0127 family)
VSPVTRLAALLLAALLALPLAGCAGEPDLPVVGLKGQQFRVEIADTLEKQARGLMFRRDLPRDRGMLFVYAQAQPQAFWMRNCEIALDILYFDAEGRFINGHYAVPPCRTAQCPTYESKRPARWVLELGGGVGRSLDLKEGDRLQLPASLAP